MAIPTPPRTEIRDGREVLVLTCGYGHETAYAPDQAPKEHAIPCPTCEPQAIRFRGVKHPTSPRVFVACFWPPLIRVAARWLDPDRLDPGMVHVTGETSKLAVRFSVDNGWAEYVRCGDEGPDVLLFRLVRCAQRLGRRRKLSDRMPDAAWRQKWIELQQRQIAAVQKLPLTGAWQDVAAFRRKVEGGEVGAAGIEPAMSTPKVDVLPLDDAPSGSAPGGG